MDSVSGFMVTSINHNLLRNGFSLAALVKSPSLALARYALYNLPNKVLAAEYRTLLPDEKLIAALPVFTALPYLQHGTSDGKLVDGQESIIIAWQTNGVKANYSLEYGIGTKLDRTAELGQKQRWSDLLFVTVCLISSYLSSPQKV